MNRHPSEIVSKENREDKKIDPGNKDTTYRPPRCERDVLEDKGEERDDESEGHKMPPIITFVNAAQKKNLRKVEW